METIKIDGRPGKQYTIGQAGILITTLSNRKLPTEEHIPFENIRSDRYFYVHKSPMLLILSGVFLMIYLLILADSLQNQKNYHPINNFTWPGIILLLLAAYFFLQPRAYFLKTASGKHIRFNIRKNESDVAAFVKNIIDKRNEYLRSKYGTPCSYLSYDSQFSNFIIMARENIITQQEYHQKLEELNKLFNQTAPAKTFPGYSHN